MTLIREAAVAGQFYPGNSRELSTTIRVLLAEVPIQAGPPPKALIVPHAGYIYSGAGRRRCLCQAATPSAAVHARDSVGPLPPGSGQGHGVEWGRRVSHAFG